MSIVSQFFDIFKHKDVNKVTGAENNTADDNESPLVVQANQNEIAMVKADDFEDSSVEPEKYTVKEDKTEEDETEEEFFEDVHDSGIIVDEGDDMSPIIMDEHEEILINTEKIDKILNDSTYKNEVLEYPINIRAENAKDDEEVEIL